MRLIFWFIKHSLRATAFLMARPVLLCPCLLLALVACTSDRAGDSYSPYGGSEEPTAVKIGKPYHVKGRRYHPRFEPDYVETGVASWYGPGFDGRMTASGERFDQHEMTAAHRTLPMPSIVEVTRLDTGKTILVRVNDRGPFSSDRIIDLSKAAADALDMIGAGTAQVRVRYRPERTLAYMREQGLSLPEQMRELERYADAGDVPPAASRTHPRPAPASAPFATARIGDVAPALGGGSRYRVQTASFADRGNAERHVRSLQDIAGAEITPVALGQRQLYRVTLSPVGSYEEASALLHAAQGMGYKDARIMVE